MGFAERYMRPGAVVPVGDWRVKQYLVTVTSAVLDSAVVAAATAYLPKPLPSSAGSDATPRVAFSVPHKGVDAIWLICTAYNRTRPPSTRTWRTSYPTAPSAGRERPGSGREPPSAARQVSAVTSG
jgi:hypothetical protein